MMEQHAFFCYHRKDDNMLRTCINSLRKVNPTCTITVATDGVPAQVSTDLENLYGVQWMFIERRLMVKRRATCKIESLAEYMKCATECGDQLLVADVDIYFQQDPFVAFEKYEIVDLGLTTRGYQHLFPINGGVFYIGCGNIMNDWVQWHLKEIYMPTWDKYVALRKKYNHERYGLDWSVGQDFLMACWYNQLEVFNKVSAKVVEVGPEFNYCPPTDTMGEKACALARDAVGDPNIYTIHLKSDLKRLIYESKLFPNAEIVYPRGTLAWM